VAIQPAHADVFSFTFLGGIYSGTGYFYGTETSPHVYDITAVYDGSVTAFGLGTSDISGIVDTNGFEGNDNTLYYPAGGDYFDNDGISFSLDNGDDVNLYTTQYGPFFVDDALGGSPSGPDVPEVVLDIVHLDRDGPLPPASTPEPGSLALLGTAILGGAGALRRRFRA
jgi:hypothetical protein